MEVRALMGMVNLFVVIKKSDYHADLRRMKRNRQILFSISFWPLRVSFQSLFVSFLLTRYCSL